MTCLAGEIKKKVPVLDQSRHRCSIAHIGKIDSHAVADVMDIEKVTSVFGDEAVDERYLRSETDKPTSQRRPYESETTGNQNVGSGQNVITRRHGGIVGCG